ncbi:site-2 protease family protein [Subdoligranulum variabile]|uniref:site-2 protease family protein n=1 Tax=Subdoligranulum variabile TaxID=214851 RepID=UPI00387FA24F
MFPLNGLLSPYEIALYLLRALVVLIAIPFHEAAHALVSHWLGDDTAVRAGRLSLNPMRHFDPLGALCMLIGGVGWAKPVGIDVRNYKNPKVGMAVSAAAGPVSNFLLAWFSMILYKCVVYSGLGGKVPAVSIFFYYMVAMNLSLAVFNLIPIPPFDGSRIALLFLPQRLYFKAMRYERQIMLVVLLLVFLGILNLPLSVTVDFLWDRMVDATGFVDMLWG